MIYVERCAVCHGLQGRGDGPEAPFLSPRPTSLISAGTSVKSDAELLAIIANGKPHRNTDAPVMRNGFHPLLITIAIRFNN